MATVCKFIGPEIDPIEAFELLNSSYRYVRSLSKGQACNVYLSYNDDEKKFYAIKILNKKDCVFFNMESANNELVLNETHMADNGLEHEQKEFVKIIEPVEKDEIKGMEGSTKQGRLGLIEKEGKVEEKVNMESANNELVLNEKHMADNGLEHEQKEFVKIIEPVEKDEIKGMEGSTKQGRLGLIEKEGKVEEKVNMEAANNKLVLNEKHMTDNGLEGHEQREFVKIIERVEKDEIKGMEGSIKQGRLGLVEKERKIDENRQTNKHLKVLRDKYVQDKYIRDAHNALKLTTFNFNKEIEILQELNHHNIIKIKTNINTLDYAFLIMEYASNGNLYEFYSTQGPLSNQLTSRYIYQVTIALLYIHKCGIMHRDVKAENILLTDNFSCIKLCDFGLSTHDKTSDCVCGTIDYFAPELLMVEMYNYKIDIWALGILIWELLIAESPFLINDIGYVYVPPEFVNEKYVFQKSIGAFAKDLIKKILRFIPSNRPTYIDILKHGFITQCY